MNIFATLLIAITVAIATAKAGTFLKDKPDFLIPCHLPDPNFNKCFAKNFQAIFHEWKDGIAGNKAFGSLDPLHVKRVVIAEDPKNPVAFNADLSNVVLRGISNMVVKDASFNPKTLTSKIKLFLPKLRFDSDYKLNGRILNLALSGNGKAVFEIENFGMLLNIQLKLRDDHGYTFSDIKQLNLEVTDVGGFHVNFENLFNGQKVLEDSTNLIFNQNWRDFYKVLDPAITQAVEAIMTDRLSKAYAYVPANYFVADIPTAAEYSA